jgi:hypothetical protein
MTDPFLREDAAEDAEDAEDSILLLPCSIPRLGQCPKRKLAGSS